MTDDGPSRRAVLAGAAGLASAALAGCARAPSADPAAASTPADATAASPYTRVYRRTIDSVATVRVHRTGDDGGQGSGFVVDDGVVVTNAHVVDGADHVDVGFTDGSWAGATVAGADPYSDLAALRVPEVPEITTPLELRREDPDIGQEVVVLGTPFGLESSLSAGIVSGVDRSLPGPAGFDIPDAIQTDAAVNPGNSGGPLVDLGGGVRGVVTAGGGENLGFAISSALARRVVPALVEDGAYDHAFMGVALRGVTPEVAEANELSEPRGVIVVATLDGGPSDGVLQPSVTTETVRGIEVPVGGDVIRRLDDRPIDRLSDLSTFLALETSPGQTIRVELLRGRERTSETVRLTLGKRPPAPT